MDDVLLDNFGVCTDEVHDDLETALRVAREMGMRWVELQAFWGKPITDLSDAELDRTRLLLDQYDMRVSSVGTLCLKGVLLGRVAPGTVVEDAHFQRDMALLRGSHRVARRLGAPMVRTFAFRRDDMVGLGNPSLHLPDGGQIPDDTLAKIGEGLRYAASETAAVGLTLGLENVRSCWANTGLNAARIIQAIDHPALRAIWDPGNDYVSWPGSYGAGYEAVKPYICHVHVKDARVVDGRTGLTAWEAVGAGSVDYVGQFAALRRDGYTGTLSLETHWHPPVNGGEPDRVRDSQTSFAGIRRALAASLAVASPPLASGDGPRR
jgi:sugar phosphate isomerase/epimerase